MPMDRRLYPNNWEEIATQIKTAAAWHCQDCNRPCRKPGETLPAFVNRIAGCIDNWLAELEEKKETLEHGVVTVYRTSRFILTVAHLDHVPANCSRDNLRALCAPCHCRYDLRQMPRKKYLKRERQGQLNLFDLVPPAPAGHGQNENRVQIPLRRFPQS